MSTEIRFLLAVVLMIGVLVITNVMFPPVPPEELPGYVPPDSAAMLESEPQGGEAVSRADSSVPPELTAAGGGEEDPLAGIVGLAEGQQGDSTDAVVTVEGPLFRLEFSALGARLVGAELLDFPSFAAPGPVELVRPGGEGALGTRLLLGSDTVDLRRIHFDVQPAEGLRLSQGDGPQELRFSYQHPTLPFTYEITYTFRPERYVVEASSRVAGLKAEWEFTDLGSGIPFNEQRDRDEIRAAAYVVNHTQRGIQSTPLSRVRAPAIEEGPLLWAAFKSKYFLVALLAGASEEDEKYLGGLIANPTPEANQVSASVSLPVEDDGTVHYRLFLGPQEFTRLEGLGEDLKDVNPYGWKFMRPIVRPFAEIVTKILSFLHKNLHIGYGWVLIIFGIMMRVVLFPLNQKGMKAQMRNMAAQPLMQEIQTKYKDNPEKLQKEMLKLYKEHGFNPLAGCLPMLLPWPVLIALFFVFQNTIELRGVPFLWLPDLSAPDPLYILPLFLGISMFLLQFVSMRSMPQQNPQMKMMMYVMPVMMVFIFFQLASGLNLYYATANIATLPQQVWIAKERKKAQAKPPLTLSK